MIKSLTRNNIQIYLIITETSPYRAKWKLEFYFRQQLFHFLGPHIQHNLICSTDEQENLCYSTSASGAGAKGGHGEDRATRGGDKIR